MNTTTMLLYIGVMAGVTYLIRMLPILVFRKKIKSRFVKSFLFYVPYAVLGAMTIPAVFSAAGSMGASLTGFVIAVVAALLNGSLTVVALLASFAAYIASLLIPLF